MKSISLAAFVVLALLITGGALTYIITRGNSLIVKELKTIIQLKEKEEKRQGKQLTLLKKLKKKLEADVTLSKKNRALVKASLSQLIQAKSAQLEHIRKQHNDAIQEKVLALRNIASKNKELRAFHKQKKLMSQKWRQEEKNIHRRFNHAIQDIQKNKKRAQKKLEVLQRDLQRKINEKNDKIHRLQRKKRAFLQRLASAKTQQEKQQIWRKIKQVDHQITTRKSELFSLKNLLRLVVSVIAFLKAGPPGVTLANNILDLLYVGTDYIENGFDLGPSGASTSSSTLRTMNNQQRDEKRVQRLASKIAVAFKQTQQLSQALRSTREKSVQSNARYRRVIQMILGYSMSLRSTNLVVGKKVVGLASHDLRRYLLKSYKRTIHSPNPGRKYITKNKNGHCVEVYKKGQSWYVSEPNRCQANN